jgi:hypothetical protein
MRAEAGAGGTALHEKLGIRGGSTLALIGEPAGVIGEIPPGITVRRRSGGHADVVVAFFVRRVDLVRRIEALSHMIHPDGCLWVAWPKRSSGLTTTLSDDVVREIVLPLGLVDNKVCAIDTTWSGLRFVWRLERRG